MNLEKVCFYPSVSLLKASTKKPGRPRTKPLTASPIVGWNRLVPTKFSRQTATTGVLKTAATISSTGILMRTAAGYVRAYGPETFHGSDALRLGLSRPMGDPAWRKRCGNSPWTSVCFRLPANDENSSVPCMCSH